MGLLNNDRTSMVVRGRAWVYEEDHYDLDIWIHELAPMKFNDPDGTYWAREYFAYQDDLREFFSLPATGNYQVLFKGTLKGWWAGYESPEWEEDFELAESSYENIPDEYIQRDAKQTLDTLDYWAGRQEGCSE